MNQRRLLMIDKLVNNNNNNTSNRINHHFQDITSAGHYQNYQRKYPWTSFMLLIIIIVIYLAIFQCFIMQIGVMASNPYVSGIKLPGNQIEDQTFYGEIKSLIGGRAELPCNLTLPSSDDAIQLIFWHRGNNTRVPIYTVDGRASQTLFNATHFLSDIFAPNRAIFDLNAKPAVLRIDPVLETDHNDYRCRVDFRWGRTTNSFVSLHVIVPPKKITIRDQHGNYVHNSTIGPYDQNTDVILTCESNGGVPPPTLQWYKNGVMMDGSYVVGNDGLVSNELTVYKLSSNDLYDKYVCQAGNYNSSNSNPIEAFVVLDINLLPIDVRIITNRSRLIAGRKIEIKCETYGSKPAAIIRWFRNDKLLPHTTETYESNRTTSSITLIPTMMDNQSLLKCRAYNPRMLPKGYFTSSSSSSLSTMSSLPEELPKDKYLESIWKLEVLYSPLVQLKIREPAKEPRNKNQKSSETSLTSSLPPTPTPTPSATTAIGLYQTKPVMVINSQTSIIIECFIQANPSLVDLQIFHNSTIIQIHKQLDVQYQNVTEFLINSLEPRHSGRYQCVASNQQGITRSNIIQLDVLYAPFCRNHGPRIQESKSTRHPADPSPGTKSDLPSDSISMDQYALALNESIKLKCDVDANPEATRFYWTLNSQWLDENHIIAQSDHDDELIYTARSSDNYGNIYCWASNHVGVQQEPCGFSIQKAGPPSPLLGCSVTNKTTTSLTVECFPGDNGGSKQMFHAHIYRSNNSEDDDDDRGGDDDDDDVSDQSANDNNNNDNGDGNVSDLKDSRQMSRIKSKNNQHDRHVGKLDQESLKSQMNLTSATSPIFYLNNLTPGTSYMIELFSKNDRGQSDSVRLSVTTLFTQNTKLISSSLQEYEYDSWFSVLIGILMTILLAVVAIYVVCHVRQRQISSRNRKKEEQIKQNFAFRPPDTNQSYLNVSDVDTDVMVASAIDKAIVDDMVIVGEPLQPRRQTPPTTTDTKLGSATTNTIKKNNGTTTTGTGTSNMNFGIKKSQQQQQHHPSPEIISFDPTTTTTTATLESTNSKLSLYVINEENDPSASIPLSNLLNKNNSNLTNSHNIVQQHHSRHHHGTPIFLNPNDPNLSALLQQQQQHVQHPSSHPIQLTTGSLLIGDPLSVAQHHPQHHHHHHHVQALFGSPFLATAIETPEHNLHHPNLNNGVGVNNNQQQQQQLTFVASNQHPCLISSTPTPSGSSLTETPPPSSQQSLQSHHYFINQSMPHETAATILYTSTIQPQTILSLNEKIDGIVLSSSTNQNNYYGQHPHDGQSMATPEATAILLHHSGQHNLPTEMSSTDEEICDFNLQQTAV